MGFDGFVYELVRLGTLALALWAFIDAVIRPAASFQAAGKLTKPGWMAITGLSALVLWWMGPLNLFGLPAVIGAVVYLVDVRPAVRALRRGGGGTNW